MIKSSTLNIDQGTEHISSPFNFIHMTTISYSNGAMESVAEIEHNCNSCQITSISNKNK